MSGGIIFCNYYVYTDTAFVLDLLGTVKVFIGTMDIHACVAAIENILGFHLCFVYLQVRLPTVKFVLCVSSLRGTFHN